MKKLLLLLLLVLGFSSLEAQVNKKLESLEYMELRFRTGKGRGFTLQPYGDFHKIGFMGRKIRPYFKDNPDAMKAFNKYRWYLVGTYGSSFVMSLGTSAIVIGYVGEEPNLLIGGLGVAITGIALMNLSGNASLLNLQKAMDYYNKDKNPSLSQLQNFLPTLRPTASNSHVGLGLVWNIQ